jgi:hypothetical protein
MAIIDNPTTWHDCEEFLEAWGIDTKLLVEANIHFSKNDIVTVQTTHLTNPDPEELQELMITRYALVELKNE